jgi:hypothetical protein
MSEEWDKIIMNGEWDSTHIIGNVKERYNQVKFQGLTHTLKGEEYDWQSFYNGWIEGRLSMLLELTKEEWNEKHDTGTIKEEAGRDQRTTTIGTNI